MDGIVRESRTYKYYVMTWGKFRKWGSVSFKHEIGPDKFESTIHSHFYPGGFGSCSEVKYSENDLVCVYNVNTPNEFHYIEIEFSDEYWDDYGENEEDRYHAPSLYCTEITKEAAMKKIANDKYNKDFKFPYIERDWLRIWSSPFDPAYVINEVTN